MLIIPVLEPLKMKRMILALAFTVGGLAQEITRVSNDVAATLWLYLKGLELVQQSEK